MESLIIIPARGGSKRLPNKNIKLLNGKPLIYYSIDHARNFFGDDKICVSTDSKEIKNIVEKIGLDVPFLRPRQLAKDTTPTQDVILHCLEWYKNNRSYVPERIVLLQPTSPLRKKKYTLHALEKYNKNLDMVVSVKKSINLKRNSFVKINSKGDLKKINFEEDVYEINGSLYIINTKSIKEKKISDFSKIRKILMKEPELSIDIDTQFDFNLCELIIKKQI